MVAKLIMYDLDIRSRRRSRHGSAYIYIRNSVRTEHTKHCIISTFEIWIL